ncbi:PAS domain-containing protein [Methylobacterium thuringiense]|uniref:histidine kinase n=1 Tax=Methylobacterium thuringiense TaxID=1003091 RepID=A0ABQ4TNI6_9HYPH|nr:PAS domain-containing protein [Methylobacterium thuringiense]GJE56938.1 hypothetical protein EKPJFOCH_3448 [Methylobacterium thuringiense]
MIPDVQSALDASGYVGAWETDLKTQTVTITGKAADLLGIEQHRGTAGIQVVEFLEGVHPENREEVAHLVHEAHTTAGRFEAEFRTIGNRDRPRTVLARGRVETGPDGQGLRCVGIMVDVTDSRRVERADTQVQTVKRITDALVEAGALVEQLGSFRLKTLIDMALIEVKKTRA